MELSETKFLSHKYWYSRNFLALQLPYVTLLLYSCFSPGYFTGLSELHSCWSDFHSWLRNSYQGRPS